MNATHISRGLTQTEIEPIAIEMVHATPKPTQVAMRGMGTHRILLLGILLLSTWMALATFASLKQMLGAVLVEFDHLFAVLLWLAGNLRFG